MAKEGKKLRYEFLVCPSAKFFCNLCHDVLYDPQLATCCNGHYCEPCIKQLKINQDPCPTCNNKTFPVQPSPIIKEELESLKVVCPNAGCNWSGRLGQLEVHLDSLTGTCDYAIVSCHRNCGMTFKRKDRLRHQCSSTSINNRGSTCPCRAIGCNIYTERNPESLSQHINNNLEEHVQLVTGYAQTLKEREDKVFKRENELEMRLEEIRREKDATIQSLTQQVKELKVLLEAKENDLIDISKDFKSLKRLTVIKKQDTDDYIHPLPKYNTFSHHFIMSDFNQYCQPRVGKLMWDSEAFYTHKDGYKLSFSVDVVFGSLRLSLFVLKGKYDENLSWPLRGSVTVLLLNQLNNSNHYGFKFVYDVDTPRAICDRVSGEGRIKSDKNVSISQKLPYESLLLSSTRQVCYLQNNSLVFTISHIDLE